MKRFTEAMKWRDPWFRELSWQTKLVFFYLLDNCDAAGVWEPDFRMVNFCLKVDIDWEHVQHELADRLQVLPSGRWWLTKFIHFQYGKLSHDCPPHKNVFNLLEHHGIEYGPKVLRVRLPLPKASSSQQEEDKEEDKDRGASKRAGAVEIPLLLQTPRFLIAWEKWFKHRAEIKKPMKATQQNQMLESFLAMGEDRAVAAIEFTIFKGWQGLQEPPSDYRPPVSPSLSAASLPSNLRRQA